MWQASGGPSSPRPPRSGPPPPARPSLGERGSPARPGVRPRAVCRRGSRFVVAGGPPRPPPWPRGAAPGPGGRPRPWSPRPLPSCRPRVLRTAARALPSCRPRVLLTAARALSRRPPGRRPPRTGPRRPPPRRSRLHARPPQWTLSPALGPGAASCRRSGHMTWRVSRAMRARTACARSSPTPSASPPPLWLTSMFSVLPPRRRCCPRRCRIFEKAWTPPRWHAPSGRWPVQSCGRLCFFGAVGGPRSLGQLRRPRRRRSAAAGWRPNSPSWRGGTPCPPTFAQPYSRSLLGFWTGAQSLPPIPPPRSIWRPTGGPPSLCRNQMPPVATASLFRKRSRPRRPTPGAHRLPRVRRWPRTPEATARTASPPRPWGAPTLDART